MSARQALWMPIVESKPLVGQLDRPQNQYEWLTLHDTLQHKYNTIYKFIFLREAFQQHQVKFESSMRAGKESNRVHKLSGLKFLWMFSAMLPLKKRMCIPAQCSHSACRCRTRAKTSYWLAPANKKHAKISSNITDDNSP